MAKQTSRVLIKVDTYAPPFDELDIFDRRISLRNYAGKKVLIGFFRHAGCPFCNMRVHQLEKNHKRFQEMGMEMIFFFESEKKTLLGNNFHKTVSPIPIIADPEKKYYNAYGIEHSPLKSATSHLKSFFSSAIKAKVARLPVHFMSGKESISTIPAEFMVNEFGVVEKLYYSMSLTDRVDIEVIEKWAKVGK